MPMVLPQIGQKPRSAKGDERYQTGSVRSQEKEAFSKWTNARAGAPECLRHVSQWHMTPRSGCEVAR